MTAVVIKAQPRELVSKGQLRKSREAGIVPAVIYGKKGTHSVQVSMKALPKGHTMSQLIQVDLEGKTMNVFMRDVQVDPLNDKPIHFDFQEVDMNETIKIPVPLEFVGLTREQEKEGSFKKLLRSIKVKGPAHKIPTKLEVNVGNLKVDESAHISDIQMPAEIKVIAAKNLALANLVRL